MLASDKCVRVNRLDRATSLLRSRFGGQPYSALSVSTFDPGFSIKKGRMLRQGFISRNRPSRRLLSPCSAACLEATPYGRGDRAVVGVQMQLQVSSDKQRPVPASNPWVTRSFRGQRKSPNRLRPDTISRRSLEIDSTMSGRSLVICSRENRQKRATSALPRVRVVKRTDFVCDSEEVAGWEAR